MSAPRSVVVTGASRGLGAALAEAFLEDGAAVATCSRSPSPLDAAAHADRLHHESFDLADSDARAAFVGRVIERFGGIDVLVNNAGVARASVLALAREEDVEAMLDLNLRATIAMTRLVARRMLRQGSGRIVNVSSVVALSGFSGLSVYAATKAGLDGFTRALARELGPRGIAVNSVAPGYVRTDMSAELDDEQLERIVRRTPAGRLAEPADVVAAVRFLASPEAGFVTGQVIAVDGGLTA